MAKFYIFKTRNAKRGGFGESCVRASNEAEAYKKILKYWRKYGLYEPIDTKPIYKK